uniref:Uncharacterized protein n=1 Tax=Parascaris equorum TaxID=6256 RepID=A0A914R3B6_PAREQ
MRASSRQSQAYAYFYVALLAPHRFYVDGDVLEGQKDILMQPMLQRTTIARQSETKDEMVRGLVARSASFLDFFALFRPAPVMLGDGNLPQNQEITCTYCIKIWCL